jgi:hypothetical protein
MTTKVLETLYGVGGYDASLPNNNVVSLTVAEQQADGSWIVSDENGTHEATTEELVLIYGMEF